MSTKNDPETTAAAEGGDGREDGRAAPGAAEDPAAGRRAALAELARLAALAPAMAVLFDPERAKADLSGD